MFDQLNSMSSIGQIDKSQWYKDNPKVTPSELEAHLKKILEVVEKQKEEEEKKKLINSLYPSQQTLSGPNHALPPTMNFGLAQRINISVPPNYLEIKNEKSFAK